MSLSELLTHCLFPTRCPACREIIAQGMVFCERCEQALPRVSGARCKVCFEPEDRCNCRSMPRWYKRSCAPFEYKDALAASLLYLKSYSHSGLIDFLAENMSLTVAARLKNEQFDCVVSVPMHRRRRAHRGYNQSELLALALADYLALPCDTRLLYQPRRTRVQHTLNYKQRRENVKGVYALRSELSYKNILLVDDIITSGFTMSECAKLLMLAGARRVCCVAAAKS